jgi:hypothetical protein
MIVANFGAFVGTEGNGDGEAVVWNCSCFCHLCDGGRIRGLRLPPTLSHGVPRLPIRSCGSMTLVS